MKMFISTAPIIFDLDKKVVNAVIMQLELENDSKENPSDAKDIGKLLKKGTEFIHVYDFVMVHILKTETLDYHYISKKYIKTYFPTIPTPPPNVAC
ncbi:hypothetical protein [Pedobacter psychrophilus]|nr:hypothetical protein [Pedobacter psychrophilus]